MERNPMLNDRYFQPAGAMAGTADARVAGAAWTGQAPPASNTGLGPVTSSGIPTKTMTFGGVTSATALMLGFVLAGGWFGWGRFVIDSGFNSLGQRVESATMPTGWLFGSMLVGFGLAIACSFKPPLARFLSIPYAIAEGIFLGIISHFYDIRTEGVALQAVVATAAVFAVMLVLYSLRVLRATPKMVKGITAATMGIFVMYLFGFIASLFGANLTFWDSPSPLGIGISLIIVGVAAFNLILDFDFIEQGVARGLPKQMEWFAAFGLVVTLVWLYLEMLRLLSKLRR